MNHLPLEVLHEIFIKLVYRDRLECLEVCRLWYDVLDRHSLLYDVNLTSEEYPAFKSMLERQLYRATQVERLSITYTPGCGLDKRKLCNMFPKLRQLKIEGYTYNAPITDYSSKPFHFLHSTSNLNKIKDFGDCKWILQLAQSNLCNTLKTLELDFFHTTDADIANNIVPQLKNMPVLENVVIRKFRLKLTDLEAMHQNLPSITSLKLDNIHPIHSEIPRKVKPATLITELKLDIGYVNDLNTHVQLYKYMGSKYPSVKSPSYSDFGLLNDDTTYVRQVYNKGILPLYQNIGSHIDTFSFKNYISGLDAFKKFDKFGMKLKKLGLESRREDTVFLEELVQSQQCKYIQELILKKVVPTPMDMLIQMEALKKLDICFDYSFHNRDDLVRKSVDLSQLIAACPPKLTKLRIDDLDLTFSEPIYNLTSIQYLRLYLVEFTPELANAIETSFPKLSTLDLSGDLNNNMTISLPNHNLNIVYITVICEEDELKEFSTKTKFDNGTQCHTLQRDQNTNMSGVEKLLYAYDSTAPKPEEADEDDLVVLNFICSSVKHISFYAEKRTQYNSDDGF
jgi:hypothetical protein